MKWKCLIVDDDPLVCDLIKYYCSKNQQIEYCISAGSGRAALEYLTSDRPDVIFLDYHLPDMKGENFLEFNTLHVPVIMVTSESEFAARSYEYHHVIDFLVKPITFDRFEKAIKKFTQTIQKELKSPELEPQEFLLVKEGNKWVKIFYSEIKYIKSDENYVLFIVKDRNILSLMSLKEVEEKLSSDFMRVHRSYIVNLKQIRELNLEEILIEKQKIPIGNTYKRKIIEYIENTI